MSDLNEIAVTPKPIERQKVSTCLKVFSDKTYFALLNHPEMKNVEGVEETALFIKKVLNWWKILNVKSKGKDIRHRDEFEAVVSDKKDRRLDMLLEFGNMAIKMKNRYGKRQKQLSSDTAKAIHHTCHGIVDLCKNLLNTTHKYVMLGKFTSDPLEKEFGKLRQGSGGTYFINVQKVLEKTNIQKARLLLSLNSENMTAISSNKYGHSCANCGYLLDECASEIFDNLNELESSLSEDIKSTLFYILGYVARHDKQYFTENFEDGETKFYYETYGKYTQELNRGGLNIPPDRICQWSIFCYILFNVVKNNVCRKSMCNLCMLISEHYDFCMERRHGNILSNIFFKNYCLEETTRSGKEPALIVLKLS